MDVPHKVSMSAEALLLFLTTCFCPSEGGSDLSRVVPGDVDSGVQLGGGGAV